MMMMLRQSRLAGNQPSLATLHQFLTDDGSWLVCKAAYMCPHPHTPGIHPFCRATCSTLLFMHNLTTDSHTISQAVPAWWQC